MVLAGRHVYRLLSGEKPRVEKKTKILANNLLYY